MPNERSTFDPNGLPNEGVIRVQNQTDLELLELGFTPDLIVKLRAERRIFEIWRREDGMTVDTGDSREDQDE